VAINRYKTNAILFHYEYLLSSFLGRLECSVTDRQTDTGRQPVLHLRIASRAKILYIIGLQINRVTVTINAIND